MLGQSHDVRYTLDNFSAHNLRWPHAGCRPSKSPIDVRVPCGRRGFWRAEVFGFATIQHAHAKSNELSPDRFGSGNITRSLETVIAFLRLAPAPLASGVISTSAGF